MSLRRAWAFKFNLSRLTAIAVLLLLVGTGALAESITGTVTNRTSNKPAAGDDVVLIRLAQGMQEVTRAKTDARGHYTLEVPEPGLHLVRATHDKANYFAPAQPGAKTIDLDVYSAAAKVEGVVGEADVMRLQTDESGKTLRVVENFFVKNDSTPPKTQFSDRPFEFYLPPGAMVEGSAALSPGGMPVQASPVPLGDANHYAFIFPIRPGETRFQVSYRLPYAGSLQLAPKPVMTTDTIAIIVPKSMKFQGGPSTPFTAMQDEVDGQTFVARNVSPSEPLGFTVSGTGELPRDTAVGTAGAPGTGSSPANAAASGDASTRPANGPGGGLGNPGDPGATNDPWAKYRWWILGGLGLVLAAGAGVMLKRPSEGAMAATTSGGATGIAAAGGAAAGVYPVAAGGGTLAALKDELFTLETERLRGTIDETEYAEHKAALERVLRRALAREPQHAAAASAAAGPGAARELPKHG